MSDYHITWLIAIFCGLASAVAIVGLGCFALKKQAEDLSNSTTLRAFMVRLVRMAPGGGLMIFGCILLWKLVFVIVRLTPPSLQP